MARWMAANLEVADLQGALAYYERVLGFTRWFTWPEDGPPRSGGVQRGEARFIFDASGPAEGRGRGVVFYVDLGEEDLDAYFAGIAARGVRVVEAPKDQPWGDRTFTILDPDGYRLLFARTIAAAGEPR